MTRSDRRRGMRRRGASEQIIRQWLPLLLSGRVRLW